VAVRYNLQLFAVRPKKKLPIRNRKSINRKSIDLRKLNPIPKRRDL
jgi:hypothetical protein